MKHTTRWVAAIAIAVIAVPVLAQPFTFVALGDTAYNGERDYQVYRTLVNEINAAKPAFSIHVGDIWGVGNCHDAHYQQIEQFFALYKQPVVYTPGDNEWVDCRSNVMGGYDANERLAKLRSVFYSRPQSLGEHPMPLVRESDVSSYTKFVENARWEHDRVLFFTLHVVGSQNNYQPQDPAALAEAAERMQANVAWMRDSFRVAREGNYRAVVVALHAQMFFGDVSEQGPFGPIVAELKIAGSRYTSPILLIHGDSHAFQIDRPFLVTRGEGEPREFTNITRLEVFGAPEIGAVKVHVDPDSRNVWGFTPILTPIP